MTQHLCEKFDPDCYRCELNQDETGGDAMSDGDSFIEWGVRYPANWCIGGYGYQTCDDEESARNWQQYHPQPNDVVSRDVTFGAWSVAESVSGDPGDAPEETR